MEQYIFQVEKIEFFFCLLLIFYPDIRKYGKRQRTFSRQIGLEANDC